jgi:hypothetical protein
MSIPFPPDRENGVTTFPFAGQYQRFTGAFPPFTASLSRFFRLPAEAVFLLLDVFEVDFADLPDAWVPLLLPLEGGGRGFLATLPEVLDEACVVRVAAVLGGCESRSF